MSLPFFADTMWSLRAAFAEGAELGQLIAALALSLVWGALFARQQSLLGVCVSHLLSGWFAFLVLGFEPWY